MDCVNYQLWFLEKLKNFFELKDKKWSGDGPLKTKITYLTILKVVPGTF